MHQPDHTAFAGKPIQPAIYICEECAIEHNGDARALPAGWDRVTDPHSHQTSVRCPDCLEAIERDWAEAVALLGYGPDADRLRGAIADMGIAAARFTGALELRS